MNLHEQKLVCWPPDGPKDMKQTNIHTYTLTAALYRIITVESSGGVSIAAK